MDASSSRPLALARRLHQRARPDPRATRTHLTQTAATEDQPTIPPTPAHPTLPENTHPDISLQARGTPHAAQPTTTPENVHHQHQSPPNTTSPGGSRLSVPASSEAAGGVASLRLGSDWPDPLEFGPAGLVPE